MVRKRVDMPNEDPQQRTFLKPSEGEHLFQVVDFIDSDDDDIVVCKCEVAEGEELGRSLLHRVSLNQDWNGFFMTRLFLKAIGEPHKGYGVEIDSDRWLGRRFYATVVHNEGNNGKIYANIGEYNFNKPVEQAVIEKQLPEASAEKAWDE